MSEPGKTANRRDFLQTTALGAGVALWAGAGARGETTSAGPMPRETRLPREVWIATVAQNSVRAASPQEMISLMLARMEELVEFEPDIVCLPEVFPFGNLSGTRPAVADVAEAPLGEISRPFADFARQHRCYVVCPIYTQEDGRCYNAAVFLDRNGEALGEYRKMHPTVGEIEAGVAPGPLEPPVFKTDFGVVGAQICFDIEWRDGWQRLREAGAEIVFWPSAFAGGIAVNTKAWQNKYCVVSSTNKDTSKICDVSGEEVARTSRWNTWVCAPVNLEKAFLHTWPYVRRFNDLHAKYGRKVSIRTFPEEEWTLIESRSADVRIADVLKEFELDTYEEHIRDADARQCACRV
jgi:predicted amidohydrolase